MARPGVAEKITAFEERVLEHIARCSPEAAESSAGLLTQQYSELRDNWRALKSDLLYAASKRSIDVTHLSVALEGLRSTLRIAEQLGKATQHLIDLKQPAIESEV